MRSTESADADYRNSLLRGYAIGNVFKQTQQYEEVCNLHTHVHESDRKVIPFDSERAVKTA